jgi:hypothetical protein
MTRDARPFTLKLTPAEAGEMLAPSGDGGHQSLHEYLRGQLAGGNLTVTLNDEQLGRVIRYMTQYGSGGFQGRLGRAFKRPLRDLLAA